MRTALKTLVRKCTFGLARRLTLVLSLVIVGCAVAVVSINAIVQKRMIEERLSLSTYHLASLIKEVSIPSILRDDPASLDVFLEELDTRSDIVSLAIVDPEGWVWKAGRSASINWLSQFSNPLLDSVLATGQPQQVLTSDYLHRAGPITVADQAIAFLDLKVARSPITAELRDLWVSTAFIGLACLFLGPFIALNVARRLSKPLLGLEAASRRVASGDFSHRINSDSNDEFDLVAASFNNMLDELNKSFLETKRVAYEDKLTAAPNRSWLSLELESLTKDGPAAQNFALLFLDVDKFKEVNDTHGHHIGDMLLRAFTRRIWCRLDALGLVPMGVRTWKGGGLDFSQNQALLARLGGDEFTVLVGSNTAESLARSIIDAMRDPFQFEGVTLSLSTSIGIALYPEHAMSRELLLKCADVAMYQAKRDGRGTFAFYDQDIHEELLARSQMEKDIDRAVANDEFELFLQPKFDVSTEMLVGAEALIRWRHPEKGYIRPDEFLPIATSMGLMPKVGEIMIGKAVHAAAAINRQRTEPITMAVNIASEELLAHGFAEHLKTLLEAHDLDPASLEVEITEGTAMQQNDLVQGNIDRLRALGVALAVDDFGIGYSNLGRLKSLAFDTLKVDRSLIEDVVTDDAAQRLFRTIIDMAEALEAFVVSEGVETSEQLSFLRSCGVKTYQGFYGAKPMPLGAFMRFAADAVPSVSLPLELDKAS